LLPGDTDETYDVYDARIPRPGDDLPPVAVPCKDSVCQGPPSVPQLLAPPASETFNGAGNLAAPVAVKQPAKQIHEKKKKRKKRKKKHRAPPSGHDNAKGGAGKIASHRSGRRA
jgi:hypothetical protein